MNATPVTEALIILTQADYLQLKQDLKAAGLDLCYVAQAGQPVRLDWSANLLKETKFLRYLEQRRPADPTYRIVSVRQTKKRGWFRPDEFALSFHAVSVTREADLQQYLSDHHIHSSAEAPKAKLGDFA